MSGPPEILIAEDERDEIEVALRALARSDLDVSVEVARDGVEALVALGLEGDADAASPLPRVVFLDLKMPRVDGWEVLRRMRDDPFTAEVPVVVLSSSDRKDDIRRSYALGANSFLVKHYDHRGPGSYIVQAARYWLEMNRTTAQGG